MSNRPLRVLIVEDNAASREALRLLMEQHGRQVRAVGDGAAALAEAGEFRPDVVLLDLGLPGMGGYEVAQKLRALPGLAETRIVAVTGHAQPLDVVVSHQAGIDTHLAKPVDPSVLEQVLQHPRGRPRT
jgi:CheY-like chemotaxis protein